MKKGIRFLFLLLVLSSVKMVEAQSFEVFSMTEGERLLLNAETEVNKLAQSALPTLSG